MNEECRCSEAKYDVSGELAGQIGWMWIGKFWTLRFAMLEAAKAAEDPKWRRVQVRRSIHFTEKVVTLTNPMYVTEENNGRCKDRDVHEQRREDGHASCPHCGKHRAHADSGSTVDPGAPGASGITEELQARLDASSYVSFIPLEPLVMYAGQHRLHHLQVWVREVGMEVYQCRLCAKMIAAGEPAYCPVTNLSNRFDWICSGCMERMPANA